MNHQRHQHHRKDARRTQTYRHASTRAGLAAAALVGAFVVPAAAASAAPAGGSGTPDQQLPAVSVAYASVDTNRDGDVDKIVLVDPSTIGAHPSTSGSAGSTAGRSSVSPTLAKLTKQLAAAKVAAAKAARANVKAQRAAATLARTAKKASATARTARQRAYARQVAKKAAVAARVATVANAKSKAAANLVKSLKKAIDRLNRASAPTPTTNTPVPTTNTPTPTDTSTPAPAPTPTTAPVSGASCDSLAPSFRPIQVTSDWQVSCVDSFPGVTIEAGYTVLGLTRYDTGQGLAQVMILRSQSANQLTATFAHELAHAYSITSMTYAQRSLFVNRIRTAGLTTATDFFSQSVSYDTMPAEIWARTQASCVGYPAPYSSFTEATCPDVRAATAG